MQKWARERVMRRERWRGGEMKQGRERRRCNEMQQVASMGVVSLIYVSSCSAQANENGPRRTPSRPCAIPSSSQLSLSWVYSSVSFQLLHLIMSFGKSLLRLSRCTLCSTRLPLARATAPTAARCFSLLSSPTTRPPAFQQQQHLRYEQRRTLVLHAQPPENPSEDFEPVEEGGDTIDLTDSAIKVRFFRLQWSGAVDCKHAEPTRGAVGQHGGRHCGVFRQHRACSLESRSSTFARPSHPSATLY